MPLNILFPPWPIPFVGHQPSTCCSQFLINSLSNCLKFTILNMAAKNEWAEGGGLVDLPLRQG
jgi:hypothetical protein